MCSFVRSLDAARTRATDTEAVDDGRATDLRCCSKRRVMNGLVLEDFGSASGIDIGGGVRLFIDDCAPTFNRVLVQKEQRFARALFGTQPLGKKASDESTQCLR